MTDTQFVLASGRKIGVSSFGDPASARIIVFCNPTAAAGAFNPDPLITDRYDVRVITIDRPGYGGSDPCGDETPPAVQTCAADISEYLAMSGIRDRARTREATVGVIGWGWGGASALSFAVNNPTDVERVAVVGTVRPSRARRGERGSHAAELLRLRFISSVSGAVEAMNDTTTTGLAGLGVALDDPDIAQLGSLARVRRLAESAEEDRAGIAFDRLSARDTSWATDFKDLKAQSLLVYGDRDTVAESADLRWYRRRTSNPVVSVHRDSGRMVIVPAWDMILRHLTA